MAQDTLKKRLFGGTLSVGVQGGVIMENFDGSELDVETTGDPAFSTSEVKGQTLDLAAGLYYTLILSAIANELDPERYLATVFIRSRLLPKERWEELLPWRIRSLEEKPDYLKRHDF